MRVLAEIGSGRVNGYRSVTLVILVSQTVNFTGLAGQSLDQKI